MASFKFRVQRVHPTAKATKEDLGGHIHHSVRTADGKWLSTPGMNTSPTVAWRGAWYSIQSQRNRESGQ